VIELVLKKQPSFI